MCTIGDNFFFLGSRLADSLLVQHTLGSASARTPVTTVKTEREEVIILLSGANFIFVNWDLDSRSWKPRLTSYRWSAWPVVQMFVCNPKNCSRGFNIHRPALFITILFENMCLCFYYLSFNEFYKAFPFGSTSFLCLWYHASFTDSMSLASLF